MDQSSRGANPHRGLWLGVGLGAVAFAALMFYGDMGDPRALRERVGTYEWRWFGYGLAGATLNYGLRFVRWEYYLRGLGIRIPTAASARIFVAGFAMSISPGKVGEVLKSALLAEEFDVPFERTAPIVLAERLTDLMALVALVAVGSLAVPNGHLLALPAFAGVALLLAFFAVPTFGRFVLARLERIRALARVLPKLHTAHASLVAMLAPGPLVGATVLALASWFLECVSLWAIVRGFDGVRLGLLESTFAYAAPTIAGAVALMPGGLLVTEAGMTGVLQALGRGVITEPVAAATTLLVRLATLWWAVLLGLCALALSRSGTGGPSTRIRSTTTDRARGDVPADSGSRP